MSRFDRDQRDAERAARRARRLAERAEQRAQRRSDQAKRAADRAERLADRANSRHEEDHRSRAFEDRVDDFVEDYSEKWSRKAEEWFSSRAASDDDYATFRAKRRASRRAARDRRYAEARSARRHRRRPRGRLFRFNTGRGFYRDKSRGKICGVCAGVADYLDVEVWQVRLVAVLGLFFAGSVAVPMYFILCFIMDDKPYYRRMTDAIDDEDEDDMEAPMTPGARASDTGRDRPRQVYPNLTNVEKLRMAKDRFAELENRLRAMESHVTSSQFELQREIRKIAGEDG